MHSCTAPPANPPARALSPPPHQRTNPIARVRSASCQALGRLTERESYDRAYRHRVASMCAIAHAPLPKKDWIPVEAVSSGSRAQCRRGRPLTIASACPCPLTPCSRILLDDVLAPRLALSCAPRCAAYDPRTPRPPHSPSLDQDVRYLKPIVSEIEAQNTERDFWDNVVVDKSKKH